VGRAQRDVDVLVRAQEPPFAVEVDLGGAVHHHPVLGPVKVLLQRKPLAGIDLKLLAGVDAFVQPHGR
jgi:hypothetical protein